MGLYSSVNLTQLAAKTVVLCTIARNDGQGPFKVTQGHQFCQWSKPLCEWIIRM